MSQRIRMPVTRTINFWLRVLSFLAKANDSTGKEKAWPVVVTRKKG